MERQVYVLRITLGEVAPPVWRQVIVPGAYTLDRLHRVVQLAMGWSDCHLHAFEVAGVQYGVPDPDMLDVRDEMDARVDAIAGKDGSFVYTYDFGDWWEHRIVVEDVLVAEPEERYPICVDGEEACPPEDCGGPYGYADLRRVLADPAHADHVATLAWFGAHTGDRAFDADRVTALLRRMA
jgi:hypothetical protein